ncbi:MAG: hypothetical protein V8S24_08525 [Gordonibacter pamelaeae]
MEGGSNTRQLVKALKEHREIVVVTIQTFFHAWADIACAEELKGCSFAVIVDEAHSSQDGDNATALKTAFNAAADRLRLERMDDADPDEETSDEDSMNEYFRRMQAGNVMPANASFFADTATPKAETKTLFGTPTGRTDEDGNPVKESFHLYPMRQAIEEGYIIDPLTGFLPMNTVTKLEYDD